jgi:hypothetical protein
MISRIRKNLDDGTPLSDGQNNFMKHELREVDLMDRGMPYEQAHAEALKEHPPGRSYGPDIMSDSPWFGPWWRRMNDL